MQSAHRKALCPNKKVANCKGPLPSPDRAPAFYRQSCCLKTVGVRVFESHRARHYLSKDNELRNQSGSSMSNAFVMSSVDLSDSIAFILVARLLPIPGIAFH